MAFFLCFNFCPDKITLKWPCNTGSNWKTVSGNHKKSLREICAYVQFYETKGETIARSFHCLVCRLHHDNEHRHAFMATNELSSFLASMINNTRYDSSTNFLELEVNAVRTIGILRDVLSNKGEKFTERKYGINECFQITTIVRMVSLNKLGIFHLSRGKVLAVFFLSSPVVLCILR